MQRSGEGRTDQALPVFFSPNGNCLGLYGPPPLEHPAEFFIKLYPDKLARGGGLSKFYPACLLDGQGIFIFWGVLNKACA